MAVHTLSHPMPRRHPVRRRVANLLVALACWIDPPFIRAGFRRSGGL